MEFVEAKTIMTATKDTSWFGSNYNMNLYRGCCHGCIYCDSRSSCYHVDDFDRVRGKVDALRILRDELRRKVKKGVVSIGAMSDPYNPFEKKYLQTRNSLELLNAYGFGVSMATKSSLVERDIGVLSDIKRHSPVIAKITVTTTDDTLCRKIEPHVSLSSQRLASLAKLSENGIFSGVLLMPVLPFLTDSEENIISVVKSTYEAGGKFIYAGFGVTLRDNQRVHYFENIDKLFPKDISGNSLSEIYMKKYGNNYHCTVPKVKKLWAIYEEECKKYGLLYNMRDIIRAYKSGYETEQISLF